MHFVELVVGVIFLLICSYFDIKKKIVYSDICIIFSALVVIIELLIIDKTVKDLLYGLIPSILVFLLSVITNESIGKGDALVFLVIGLLSGCINTMLIFLFALLIVVVCAIPLIIMKYNKIKDNIAFSPFVLIAFMVIFGLEVV